MLIGKEAELDGIKNKADGKRLTVKTALTADSLPLTAKKQKKLDRYFSVFDAQLLAVF
jgi:hypothetical protein